MADMTDKAMRNVRAISKREIAIALLTRGKTEHTGSHEWEASFLLRRAYPRPDSDE